MRRQILEFIQEYTAVHSYSPTFREIGEEVGLAVSCVHYWMKKLVEDGALEYVPHKTRTIVLH